VYKDFKKFLNFSPEEIFEFSHFLFSMAQLF